MNGFDPRLFLGIPGPQPHVPLQSGFAPPSLMGGGGVPSMGMGGMGMPQSLGIPGMGFANLITKDGSVKGEASGGAGVPYDPSVNPGGTINPNGEVVQPGASGGAGADASKGGSFFSFLGDLFRRKPGGII